MLLPFITLDLMTTGRDFLYQSLMVWIVILLIQNRKIPIVKLVLACFLVTSFEVIRVVWKRSFEWEEFLFIPGELRLSAESGLLILESNKSVDMLAYVIYSIGKVFTPQAMTILFNGTPHFSKIITEEASFLHFGLGGSLLSEVFSFKNNIALILYPFLIIVYLEFINLLRRKGGMFGLLVFVYFLMSTISMFRAGVLFAGVDPFYYAIYACIWYWVLVSSFNSRKLSKTHTL
ncbi:MAG: hypothetical protein L3J89_07420 [Gammaproteobacteria bacterium]|nr:hypothetical protein [Gammaproteobacteria bacterium]